MLRFLLWSLRFFGRFWRWFCENWIGLVFVGLNIWTAERSFPHPIPFALWTSIFLSFLLFFFDQLPLTSDNSIDIDDSLHFLSLTFHTHFIFTISLIFNFLTQRLLTSFINSFHSSTKISLSSRNLHGFYFCDLRSLIIWSRWILKWSQSFLIFF